MQRMCDLSWRIAESVTDLHASVSGYKITCEKSEKARADVDEGAIGWSEKLSVLLVREAAGDEIELMLRDTEGFSVLEHIFPE
jgi:hypothetical protein